MNANHSPSVLRAGVLALLCAFPLAGWAAVAGQFQFVAGDVRILASDGRERPARKGQDISEGETVVTGVGASAQLKMIDGGILALRPDSQLKMTAYSFKGREDGSEKADMSLVKGGLRAISGLIGKTNKQNYAITTPTATIGIRGTDHEPVVVLPPPPGQPAVNPPGTYNKVNVGATTLTTLAGTTVINPNQVGFAPAPNVAPVLLPRIPNFYQVTPLPSQGRAQSGPGQQGGSTSTNSSTTSSRSGNGGGEALRVSSDADSAPVTPTGNQGPSTSLPTTPVTTVAAETKKTATDGNSNTLDVTEQKVVKTDGTTFVLTETNVAANTTTDGTVTKGPVVDTTSPEVQVFNGTANVDLVVPEGWSWSTQPYRSLARDLASRFDGNGKLLEMTYGIRYENFDLGRITMTLGGAGETVDFGTHGATGLRWGRWSGGNIQTRSQLVWNDDSGKWGYGKRGNDGVFVIGDSYVSTEATPASGVHWIAGVQPAPDYLARVLTGTATYNLVGGTSPTNAAGASGLLRSASLNVDFTHQLADAFVGLSIAGTEWGLEARRMILQGSRFSSSEVNCSTEASCGFRAFKGVDRGYSYGNGYIGGTLTGATLNGASLVYQYTEDSAYGYVSTANFVSTPPALGFGGVVALAGGPANPLSQVWRTAGVSTGWNGAGETFNSLLGNYNDSVRAIADFRGHVEGGEGPVMRFENDGTGKLTQFIGRASLSEASTMSDAVIRAGSDVDNTNFGSTALGAVNVSWGRWAGGTINVLDRNGNALGTIDNTGRSLHWMSTGNLTGPITTLPLTGSATYTLEGHTLPTDMNGQVGALGAATLSANFTDMKVNAAVTVNIGPVTAMTTLSTNATGIPLQSHGGFSSTTLASGFPGGATSHTASCTGSACAGSTAQAYINGQFIGAGAAGAALAYGIVSAPAASVASISSTPSGPGIAVTGVAVFKR